MTSKSLTPTLKESSFESIKKLGIAFLILGMQIENLLSANSPDNIKEIEEENKKFSEILK